MPYKGLVVLFTFLSAVAHAQWLNFRESGVPRTANGSPSRRCGAYSAIASKTSIKTGALGMEIGTQHKYNFDILVDFKPGESPMRPGVKLMRPSNVARAI